MWAQFPGIVIDANNSIFNTDSFDLNPFSDSNNSAWQDVVSYAKEQRDLARSEDINKKITDVEALARIAERVAEWSEENYFGKKLETLMFVRGLAELLCRTKLTLNGLTRNPNQITGFRGDGFKSEYKEGNGNQVDHFVAYVQASYYGGYAAGILYLGHREGWDRDHPDWKLGVKACNLGLQLRLHADPPWPLSLAGTAPSGVDWWIRKNLAE
jgi:hypothetical protein